MVVRNIDHEKIMMTIDKKICDLIRIKASERGISFQDFVRIIIGEWAVKNNGKKEDPAMAGTQ